MPGRLPRLTRRSEFLRVAGRGGKAAPSERIVLGGIGRHTFANVDDNPIATLVWPPVAAGGYSLIVDGAVSADEPAATVSVTPTKAILHRPAPGEDGQRVGNDCQPIPLEA